MKAKLYVCIILTALIAVFTVSGCNKAPEIELVATMDEATVDEVVISSTAIIKTTTITTVAPTETTVGETTTAPETTTKAEEVTEAIEVNNQTPNKVTASNTDKTENNAPVNTQKPNNTSSNANSNTTSNTEKPKPKPVETKTVETQPPVTEAPVVITDDTPLTFEQMNTAENMQKIVDYCNAYFETLGMTYNEELDPSWAGWYYGRQGGLRVFDVSSVNEQKQLTAGKLKQQVDAILIDFYNHEYSDFYFKTVYVVNELDGYYDIVFCYG
ncbi:MAG: hypothetical protein IJZ54_01220 [Clostridia bacterium]|nr:hypothetical protein [Clostridia bacterium]